MFRDPKNALQPNYNFLPVGYHGRASSVVISGTPITRPHGQILLDPSQATPTFSPCRALDIELELACFLCKSNTLGKPIKIQEAEEYVFGYVLMNDWSARDIQRFEYVPLGPFTAKSFATSISPWIVLPCALSPFSSPKLPNPQASSIAKYLREANENSVYNINLSVELTTPDGGSTVLSNVSAKNLMWSFPQMIAHHSIGGCNMRVGDLLGSGTISGNSEKGDDFGSLIEMNGSGKREIMLAGMDVRTFLKDGDSVTIRGYCGEGDEGGVGFGECVGTVESAVNFD
jgi:fumarylacetoacetase